MSDIQITISTTDANSAVVIQRVTDSLKGLGSETTKTTDAQKGLASSLPATTGALSDAAVSALKTGAAFAGVALSIKGVWSAAEEAARRQEVKQGFKELAASVGLSGDEIIAKMRKVTGETVSNGELMKAASKTITLGVVANADEMARLMEIARSKSRGLNQTTIETFNQLVDAINRGTPKALKPLGIDLPSAIDKSISKMGDAEKKATILGSVLETEGAKIERLGGVHDSAADKFRRFDVAVGQIKGSLVNLALELTPVIELVAKLTRTMADFINTRDAFAEMSGQQLQAVRQDTERLLNDEIASNQDRANDRAKMGNIRSDDPDYMASGSYLSSQKELELRETLKNIDAHIETRKELDKTRQKYLDSVKDQVKADNAAIESSNKHNDSLKEKKETFEALSKAMRDAFEEMQKYASADDLEQMGMTFADLAHQAEAFIDALGMSRLEPVRGMLINLAQAAGMLSGNLQKAGAWISGGAQGTVAAAQGWIKGDVLGERYSGTLYDMATGLWQNSKTSSAESMFGGIENFTKTFWNALSKPSDKGQTEDALRAVLEKPLARVFNDAMVSGLEEGNFFSALEKGFKRIVYQNISDAMTIAVFGGSSSSKAAINGATGSTGGSGGLLSGLTNGGSIWRDGKLQTGNLTQMLGTNLALGLVTNKLFGAGGLFGSSVIHGGEVVQQATDINTQVKQAADQRSIVAGQSGISDATFEKLQSLIFYGAGYTSDKSGNGITSKKTTTYALDAAQAQASLAEYGKLVAQASAEASAREYEKSFAAITSPTKALAMTIEDLDKVVKRATDANGTVSDSGKQALLQIEQIKAQLASTAIARAGDWFDYTLSNPFAKNSIAETGFFDDGATLGDYAMSRYKNPRVPDPKTAMTIGGNSLYGADISTYLDQRAMIGGIKDQYKKSFDMYAMSIDPAQKENYLTARAEQFNEQMATAQKLADLAEAKVKDLTLTMEARAQAFQEFQQAEAAYYTAKQQALDVEIQQKQDIKDKQDALKNDKISDALTFLGEIREKGGQTIMILNAGSPDTVDRLKQIRDGLDSEGAAVIQQVIERFGGSSNPALRL
ncbi:MAG TPA: hypothetical protein PKM25_06430 [Candidatus Ozemobacteraceae bacterium]|nr:hypothetical protein [Candidatus Ozemobacteraceae bacterium]